MIEQSILDRILKRYQKAIQYSTIDPEVALGESRKTAEAILKILYTQQKEQEPGNQLFNKPVEKKMLSDLASIMEKIKRYPLIVATAVRTIQAFGNIGAHDQGAEADHVDAESIQACTTALKTLMKWFWNDCDQDMSQLSDAEPSSVEPSIASALNLASTVGGQVENSLTEIAKNTTDAVSPLIEKSSSAVESGIDKASSTIQQADSSTNTTQTTTKSTTPILI